MYVKEVTVRYRLRRLRATSWLDGRMTTPREAAEILTAILGKEIVEVCGVVCLSLKYSIVAYHELSRGTLNSTVVHPRDVFRVALLTNAAAIIVCHNHPSGDPAPSADDCVLTQRLHTAAEVLGVDLSDHVIVTTEGKYYSFQEAGRL